MKAHASLKILALAILTLMLNGCCISEAFDDDDVNPAPHNEGNAGDV